MEQSQTPQQETPPQQPSGSSQYYSQSHYSMNSTQNNQYQKQKQPNPMLIEQIEHYKSAIPNMDPNESHLYYMYTPHIEKLYYSNAMKNQYEGRVVYINAFEGSKMMIRVQLCGFDEPLKAPFGIQEAGTKDRKADPSRKNLELTVENDELNTFLSKFDEKNLIMAKAKRDDWFKTDLDDLKIYAFYRSLITPVSKPKNPSEPKKNYKPTFRTKVTTEGEGATRVFIKVGEEVDPNTKKKTFILQKGSWKDLKKGVLVIPIGDITGIWFMATQFGMGIQLTDVIVIPNASRPAANFKTSEGDCNILIQEKNPNEDFSFDTKEEEEDEMQKYIDGAIPYEENHYQMQSDQTSNALPMYQNQTGYQMPSFQNPSQFQNPMKDASLQQRSQPQFQNQNQGRDRSFQQPPQFQNHNPQMREP